MFVGGHVKPDVYNLASSAAKRFGVKAGAEIAEFELANLDALKDYIQESSADCDFNITQAVDVQLSEEYNEAFRTRYNEFIADGGKCAPS